MAAQASAAQGGQEAERRVSGPSAGDGRIAERVFELAWQSGRMFGETGWAGLSDEQAGATILMLRSGPIESYLRKLPPADRLTSFKFALVMMTHTGARPCRLEMESFLPGMTSPFRVVARSAGSPLGWDALPDIDAMGSKGTGNTRVMNMAGKDAEKGDWRGRTISALLACEDTRGVEPEALGRATASLRRGLPMDAVDGGILLTGLLQLAQNMRSQKAAVLRMTLGGATNGAVSYGDVEGVAWTGGGDVPDALDDAPEIGMEDAFLPGTKLQQMTMRTSRGEDGAMRVDGFQFRGNVLN